jgi:hypothetical protein
LSRHNGQGFGVSGRTALNVFRRHGIPTRASGTNQWNQKPTEATEPLPIIDNSP